MENKTSKYFKYAIGEIILVVIGILIALQINNWNEDKRERKVEVKLLIELQKDLIATKKDLVTDIKKSNIILDTTDALYRQIIDGRANNNNFQLQISELYFSESPLLFAKLTAYKSIEAYGINIISNDSLRRNITDLYELHINRVKLSESLQYELSRDWMWPYLKDVSNPVNTCKDCSSLKDQFKTIENSKQNIYVLDNPKDEFIHMLKRRYNIIKGLKVRYNLVKTKIDELIKTIDIEINLSS